MESGIQAGRILQSPLSLRGARGGAYLVEVAEPVVALVGDDDAGLLRFDGGIGKVGGVAERALCDGLEQGRFTDIGKTNLNSKTCNQRKAKSGGGWGVQFHS